MTLGPFDGASVAVTEDESGYRSVACTRTMPRMPSHVAIPDASSLDQWRRELRSLTPTRHLPAVEFRLPQLSSERNRTLSALADDYRKDCGCSIGRFLMSAAFATSVLAYFLSGGRVSEVGLHHVLWLVGVTVVAALTGKLVGLLWARWKLIRLGDKAYGAALGSFSPGRSPAKG